MVRVLPALAVGVSMLAGCSGGERSIQRALDRGTGTIRLPPGVTLVSRELKVPANARNLEIVGSGTSVLKAAPGFEGRAVLYIDRGNGIRLRDFAIDGSRADLARPMEIPRAENTFVSSFPRNGVVFHRCSDVRVSAVRFQEIANFAVLAAQTRRIEVEKVLVRDSGSRNHRGRNNTTGGILLEEGTDDFEIRDSVFRSVLGNAIWTHSTFRSPRNVRGRIAGNRFDTIGRDAIQIGHASEVRVENNRGRRIGFPHEAVDIENGGIPVAVDTAGNVDRSVYTRNHFEEINGKCFDLDGFHDGEISFNTCVNSGRPEEYPRGGYALVMNNANPDMQSRSITVRGNVFDGTRYGGIFVIGDNHRIVDNTLRNLNKARCMDSGAVYGCTSFQGDPGLLEAGIYLGLRAEREAPSRNTLVTGNVVSGYRMKRNCIKLAPTLSPVANTIRANTCSDD